MTIRRRKIKAMTDDKATPPPELIDYHLWCAKRRLRPYGDAKNPDSMRRAVGQHKNWMEHRQIWADAHDVSEKDMPDECRDEPWDPESI